jgi:hypothetical protein
VGHERMELNNNKYEVMDEHNCRKITGSLTNLSTIFMAKFRGVMENGLKFGPTDFQSKFGQWRAAQDGRMEKGEEGEILR